LAPVSPLAAPAPLPFYPSSLPGIPENLRSTSGRLPRTLGSAASPLFPPFLRPSSVCVEAANSSMLRAAAVCGSPLLLPPCRHLPCRHSRGALGLGAVCASRCGPEAGAGLRSGGFIELLYALGDSFGALGVGMTPLGPSSSCSHSERPPPGDTMLHLRGRESTLPRAWRRLPRPHLPVGGLGSTFPPVATASLVSPPPSGAASPPLGRAATLIMLS
jgi:hypothetical protein